MGCRQASGMKIPANQELAHTGKSQHFSVTTGYPQGHLHDEWTEQRHWAGEEARVFLTMTCAKSDDSSDSRRQKRSMLIQNWRLARAVLLSSRWPPYEHLNTAAVATNYLQGRVIFQGVSESRKLFVIMQFIARRHHLKTPLLRLPRKYLLFHTAHEPHHENRKRQTGCYFDRWWLVGVYRQSCAGSESEPCR